MFKNKIKTKPIVETITVGSCLKAKREELGFSLLDLSKKLGIKYEYLKNLEEGDYAQLPPQVYVRGFIKSYSDHLNIDASQLVKIYNRETSLLYEDEIESKKREEKGRNSGWKNYVTVTPRILTGVFSLCIVTVLGYYFMHQINSFNSKPYLFVDNPVADGVVKDKNLWVSGKTEDDAILKINGQEIVVSAAGDFSQKITLAEGRNLLLVEAKNRFNKTDTKEINIVYEKAQEDKLVIQESTAEPVAEPTVAVEIVEEKAGTVAGAKTTVAPTKKETVSKKESDSVLGTQAYAASIEDASVSDAEIGTEGEMVLD